MSTDFLYVAGRLFYPVNPDDPRQPEALTAAKAASLLAVEGTDLTLDVDLTPFPSHRFDAESHRPLATGTATVLSATWKPIDDPRIPAGDGSLTMAVLLEPEDFAQVLLDYRFPEGGQQEALARRLVNWGTQNWCGLTLSISRGAKRLLRMDIDVYGPEELPTMPVTAQLYAVSVDPDRADEPADPKPMNAVGGATDETATGTAEAKMVQVCVCHRCGSGITVPTDFLDAAVALGDPNSESIMLLPCAECGTRHSVRKLSPADRHRRGVSYEVMPAGEKPNDAPASAQARSSSAE
jgi:hypothetical protein